MFRSLAAVALLGLSPLVSSCAPTGGMSASAAPDRTPRTCFNPDQITNFAASDSHRLYVRVTPRTSVYEITSGGCMDLETTNQLVVMPMTRGLSQICVGDSVLLATPGSGPMAGQCVGRVMRTLSEAEVEALPSRDRP